MWQRLAKKARLSNCKEARHCSPRVNREAISIEGNSKTGFLLLYVSMVLAFVLIIVMLAVPHLSFLSRHVVRQEVENLKQFITYAHRLALATGEMQTLTIDAIHNKVSGAGRQYQLARGVRFGVLPHVQGPPAHPDGVILQPTTFKNNQIVCYAHGIIDAGTLYITDDRGSWLYAVSSGVSPVSYLRTYYYDGSWKRCT